VTDRSTGRSEAKGRWSLPLVRIAGVTIRVHITFLLLVALVAMSANSVGESVPGAVGWLVALFACVVAHELSHALVARSKGVAVHEIDLLPIGGVSRLERIPEDWRDESAIAVAGPIASVGVAAVAFLVAAAAGLPLLPPTLWDGPILVRLAWVNLMLAGFNLLPAFPLDGGRVLRALLERDRSRVEATRQAVAVSRLLASALIGAGLLLNLWLIVIGVFVMMAGRAEELAVLVHAALGPTAAQALAVPSPLVLGADLAAAVAVDLATAQPQAAYPVAAADGTVLGLVNLGTLRGAPPDTPVGRLATGATVDALESLESVAETMTGVPVVVTSGTRVVGVITPEILDGYLRQRLHEVDQ
jgi:stage IV sporulation protein FB